MSVVYRLLRSLITQSAVAADTEAVVVIRVAEVILAVVDIRLAELTMAALFMRRLPITQVHTAFTLVRPAITTTPERLIPVLEGAPRTPITKICTRGATVCLMSPIIMRQRRPVMTLRRPNIVTLPEIERPTQITTWARPIEPTPPEVRRAYTTRHVRQRLRRFGRELSLTIR